ncbi:hypothetical protein [Desulfovibrio sp. JC010]|uniref:hypothetical protein n=1 Tax=Desulfovibrio sp. JC010 TaxID=2593641 RepID=UPI0013D8457E|nr:hypothetical protein [Desulfovibrio sp. JC010]NDV27719.1 hypothetical protein [Desulfovibrio sp. JC010]
MPNSALDGMKAVFKEHFPDCKTVKKYTGRFTAKDIFTVSTRNPAILISSLGIIQRPPYSGGRLGIMRVAAFVLVTPSRDESKHRVDPGDIALNLVGRIMLMLDDEWKMQAPENVSANNMSASCKGTNACLWAVSWEQSIELQDDNPLVEEYEGVTLRPIMLGQAPNIGADHEDDYVEIVSAGENDAS